MILRESRILTAALWILSSWSLLFAVLLAWLGDKVTSRQWLYLLSVPGHKWFWAVLFGSAAVMVLWGLTRGGYGWRGAGLFLAAVGCTIIAGFYLFSPLIDPGLLTLGYIPWFPGAGFLAWLAAINWRPTPWS